MKPIFKILILFLFLLFTISFVKAQKYAGQFLMNISGGPVNDGFACFIGGEKYLGRTYSSLRGEFGYMRNGHDFNNIPGLDFKVNTVTFSLCYFYSLERFTRHAFYINIGGGLITGLEDFHGDVPQGIVKDKNNNFLCGLIVHPQVEFNLNRNFSLYLEPSGAYYFQNSQSEYQFSCNLGLKYYFRRYRF